MCKFCSCLHDLDLLELHLYGWLYTWSNKQVHRLYLALTVPSDVKIGPLHESLPVRHLIRLLRPLTFADSYQSDGNT
jgi:hypothetical protein